MRPRPRHPITRSGPDLHRLRCFILAGNQDLGDEGISHILRAPFAMRLWNLNLALTGKSAATAESAGLATP